MRRWNGPSRMVVAPIVAALVLAVLAGGCGQDEPDEGRVDAGADAGARDTGLDVGPDAGPVERSLAELAAARLDHLETFCACYYGEVGFGSAQACVEGTELEADTCVEAAAQCDPQSFLAVSRCLTDAVRDFRQCLASCPSQADADACQVGFDADEVGCETQASEVLAAALSACRNDEEPQCP